MKRAKKFKDNTPGTPFGKVLAELREEESTRGGGGMFRNAYATHLSLSQMVDQKAHLMLGLNTFVLSCVLVKKHGLLLSGNTSLLVPNLLLATLCVTCIILAILASRPAYRSRKPLKPGQHANWLFFGDFSRYTPQEFHRQIGLLTRNKAALSEAMSRDLYWLGASLGRKYRYLALCYQVFFVGVILLAVVFAWYHKWV